MDSLWHKIKKALSKVPGVNFLYYKVFLKIYRALFKKKPKDAYKTIDRDIHQSILELATDSRFTEKKNILCSGNSIYNQMGAYVDAILKSNPDYNMVVLADAVEKDAVNAYEDFLVVYSPKILHRGKNVRHKDINLSKFMVNYVEERPYLYNAAQSYECRNKGVQKRFSQYYAYNSEKYINTLLDVVKPECVLVWNQFTPYHQILIELCKQRQIKISFCEYGVLPGTFALEDWGQMGESSPAVEPEKFLNLPVTQEEINNAKNIWEYLKVSRLNRKVQPDKHSKEYIISKLDPGKPTVFYAGQNDPESGIMPYTEKSKQYHSPVFTSSDDAAIFLANLAKKNGWNFLYKEHPIMENKFEDKLFPDNLILLKKVDINDVIDIADVTITTLSQTAYVSLIREKATLMVGYNQLKQKQCCYEAYTEEDVEQQIQLALSQGFTVEQAESFKKHIAQLVKYYLYDDGKDREMRYGKSISQAAEYFTNKLACDEKTTSPENCERLYHLGYNFDNYVTNQPTNNPLEEQANTILDNIKTEINERPDFYNKKRVFFLALIGGNNLLRNSTLISQMAALDNNCQFISMGSAKNIQKKENTGSAADIIKLVKPKAIEDRPLLHLSGRILLEEGKPVSIHTKEMSEHIQSRPYLQHAVKGLREGFSGMNIRVAEYIIYCLDKFIYSMLELIRPDTIILWNKHHPFHYVAGAVCKEKNIDTMYAENGVLPCTFNIERIGQMGESWPAQHPQEFMELPITKEDYSEAGKIWEYLEKTRLNRKKQPVNSAGEDLQKKLRPGRPIILYAGQNDFESGIYPYDDESKKHHSPSFKSSDDAAIFLAKIAEKNDWNLIYKPHPIVVGHARHLSKEEIAKHSFIYVTKIDINDIIDMSDLVVTILSQTSYVSLTRKKPTLLLGYTQLKNKGCCYEAFSAEVIEDEIKKALKNGFTNKQGENFQKHIAQVNKYYLFDDLMDKPMSYGRNANECLGYILENKTI